MPGPASQASPCLQDSLGSSLLLELISTCFQCLDMSCWHAGAPALSLPQRWLRCRRKDGGTCSQCIQGVADITYARYTREGRLPHCRAHGPHPHAGLAQYVALLLALQYQGPVVYEWSCHSHESISRQGQTWSRRPAFRLDCVHLDALGNVVAVEFNGREHGEAVQIRKDVAKERCMKCKLYWLQSDSDESQMAALSDMGWLDQQHL
jgi:hypothetical protein